MRSDFGPINEDYTALEQLTKVCGTNNILGACNNFVFISGIETGISDIEADNWIESRELILNNARVENSAV